ncbi:hypothetical protein B296_00025337 [Ensete ventricosum]|uniref:Uncharacterized protein n=1 Tax=Ensete ventricosum TaxID=4639 RepID=A0A426ZWY6_ENSVE|nr:hypothetical protein B296_00025337 [Ensete ventricosum]
MLEVGETKAHLKQLEVALEMSEDKRQHAEKESSLAKEKAGNAALEVRRLELMLSSVTEERDRVRKEAIMLSKQKIGNEGGLSTETLVKNNLYLLKLVLLTQLGHGDYSAANTKVLRMVNTLAVDNEAKHTIEALRAELKRTQAKLQAVEELKGQSGINLSF